MFYVFTDLHDGFERYWTGALSNLGAPKTTASLSGALEFPTARAAYEIAGREGRTVRSLLNFRVGRRPDPINLRSLIS